MKQKLYNLKMQILRDLSIKDDLKKDLSKQIFQIEKELAINYSPCCMELKDKKELTFDEWIKENNYRKVYKGYTRNQIHFGDEEMLQRYNYYKRRL